MSGRGKAQKNLDLIAAAHPREQASPAAVQRPYAVRVVVSGRRCIFGRYVSLRAAYAERRKLEALGWQAVVEVPS